MRLAATVALAAIVLTAGTVAADEPPDDYWQWRESRHVAGDECGPWTWTCWRALREAGIGPLMKLAGDVRHRSWLKALGDTLYCESKWNPTLRYSSSRQLGVDRGVAQINSYYWPEITDAQADDPAWAIRWMVNRWVKGRAYLWMCWHLSQRAVVPSWVLP